MWTQLYIPACEAFIGGREYILRCGTAAKLYRHYYRSTDGNYVSTAHLPYRARNVNWYRCMYPRKFVMVDYKYYTYMVADCGGCMYEVE